MADYDAIIIGAGHNGLTAANVLAQAGARVLVLERARFVGGMAATRQLFDGFKHSVGAWAVLVWSEVMTERLQLHDWDFELVEQWASACTFGDEGDTPFVMYNNPDRMARHMMEDHNADVMMGLGGLFAHMMKFEPYFAQARFDSNIDIFEVIAAQADAETRHDFAQMWFGSAMDTVRRFLPAGVGGPIQGSMAAMAIDGFDGGPWTPGSAVSLLYHYMLRSPGEATDRILMPRGGIGSLSHALQRRAESMGAEVLLNTEVKSIVIDNGTATGISLRDGSTITADVVLSSLDPHTTFLELAGAEHLPPDYVRKLKEINYNLGYLQAHMTIEGEPEFVDWLQPFVHDEGHTVPTLAYLPSAEYVSDGWDEYRYGAVPSKPICYLYLPSIVDHTLAPEGYHSATVYAPYFPYGLDPDTHRDLKESYADACIASIDKYSPGFSERIGQRVVMSDRYFNSAFSAHNGDFTHGTLSPLQLWSNRMVPGEPKYGTPVTNLFMCGQGTHCGPGVTGIPGWNGAQEAVQILDARSSLGVL
ncbi:NAD(P)/FAD-dependent oxidoreductase [Mycobacterium sp. UM_CSW]|uniref:phytoene desaturase family protein n=1 Tax=Mycobacterium sp. UM_CSW TaxID=1370119 RepID=UPI0004185F2E|nr:NAD(P)/FAD-dependent oxidoreductase [Mycobacterium sp. UM_CSW]